MNKENLKILRLALEDEGLSKQDRADIEQSIKEIENSMGSKADNISPEPIKPKAHKAQNPQKKRIEEKAVNTVKNKPVSDEKEPSKKFKIGDFVEFEYLRVDGPKNKKKVKAKGVIIDYKYYADDWMIAIKDGAISYLERENNLRLAKAEKTTIIDANKESTWLKGTNLTELPLRKVEKQVRTLIITDDFLKDNPSLILYRQKENFPLEKGDIIEIHPTKGYPITVFNDKVAKNRYKSIGNASEPKVRITKEKGTTVSGTVDGMKFEGKAYQKDQGEDGLNGGKLKDLKVSNKQGETIVDIEEGEFKSDKPTGELRKKVEKIVEKIEERKEPVIKTDNPVNNVTPPQKTTPVKAKSIPKNKDKTQKKEEQKPVPHKKNCKMPKWDGKGPTPLELYLMETAQLMNAYASTKSGNLEMHIPVPLSIKQEVLGNGEYGRLVERRKLYKKQGLVWKKIIRYVEICPSRGVETRSFTKEPIGFNARSRKWKTVVGKFDTRKIMRGELGVNDVYCNQLGKKIYELRKDGKGISEQMKEFYQACIPDTSKALIKQVAKTNAEVARKYMEKNKVSWPEAVKAVNKKERKKRM